VEETIGFGEVCEKSDERKRLGPKSPIYHFSRFGELFVVSRTLGSFKEVQIRYEKDKRVILFRICPRV